jgi:hypothetical protein
LEGRSQSTCNLFQYSYLTLSSSILFEICLRYTFNIR